MQLPGEILLFSHKFRHELGVFLLRIAQCHDLTRLFSLYLNFEHYAGISELLPDMQTLDLADLLYFLNAQKDKFRLRLQTILKHKGALAYVPPVKSGQNLITVTPQEWLGLLERIEELEEYEYVVLDLGESMQGLFVRRYGPFR